MIVFTITEGTHVPQLDVGQAGAHRSGGVHRHAGAGVPGAARHRHLRPVDRRQDVDGAGRLRHLASNDKTPDIVAMVIALGACAIAGFVSGFFVVKLKVNSFIATLGMSQVIIAVVAEDLEPVDQRRLHRQLPRHRSQGAVRVAAVLVLHDGSWPSSCGTCSSTRRSAVTCSPSAATRKPPGSPVCAPTGWSGGRWSASALIAGFAGIIYGWKVGNYASTVGPGYLFPAIAAVFFGASQLKGRPNVWGTFIALYALAWGIKGLQLTFPTEHAVDRAAVPGRVAAGGRVARQPQRRWSGCRGGSERRSPIHRRRSTRRSAWANSRGPDEVGT